MIGHLSVGRKTTLWIFGILICLLVCSSDTELVAADTFKEKITGAEFPKEVTFTGGGKAYTLETTGAAVRIKWFTKGYVIAHYIQDPLTGSQSVVLDDIFSDDKAKQMTMLWLHRLPLKLIRDSFRESLTKVLGPTDAVKYKDDIEKFVDFFKKDAEEQDRHYIRWMPGGIVELYYNDEKMGSLINADLARALWTIWLGPDSVVNRRDMMQFAVTK